MTELNSVGARFAWLVRVARERRSRHELAVAVALAGFVNGRTGTAWPSVRTIAAQCGLDIRHAWHALRRLADAGLLRVVAAGGPARSATYALELGGEQSEATHRGGTHRRTGMRQNTEEPVATRREPECARVCARLRRKLNNPLSETSAMTLDLECELRRRRLANGRYVAPERDPHDKPDHYKPLATELARALAEPPDPDHAAEAARHLIDCYPQCRVGREAYASGLADIISDDGIPPPVVRHVCRRVRAEAKSLPPLAELRERMLAELRARQGLLAGLESFPRKLAEAHKREAAEAERIAAAAARHGATLPPSDIVAAWHGIAYGWLHERVTLAAMRLCEDVCFEDGDCLIAALETGRPPEVFQAAAELVPALAANERARNAALATAPEFGTPEGDAWDCEWPAPEAKFADRIAPLVAAFRQTHKL